MGYNCNMSLTMLSQLESILSQENYHITKARRDTFELLINPEPQSMNEILKKAKNKVDKVTVYRNIDLFEKLGIVHKIYIGWTYKLELSDIFITHHHHMSCIKCGIVIDVDDEKHIDEFISELASKFNFVPRQHQFEIDGYCLNCQNINRRDKQ